MIPSLIGAIGGSPWSPLLFFGSGEDGLWLSSATKLNLFQSSGGTTPVTTTGNPVGYWGDQSGNGNHVIQATSSARPSYSSVSPSVTFDGVNDNLALAAVRFKTGASQFIDGTRVLVSSADTGTADNWFEVGVDTVGRLYIESNASGTKHTVVGTKALSLSTAYSLMVVHDGTDWYMELDGIEQNPLIIESVGAFAWFGDVSGADNLVIGATITSAGFVRGWKGEISEVIISDGNWLA